MIIGLCGAAGSGKTTAAKYLVERYGFVRGSFAATLKSMIEVLLFYRGVDAETIKRMIGGDLKDVATVYLKGVSPRHAMQTLGTEWGRNTIHNDLWVDVEMAAKRNIVNIVFDDIRFQNEADAIRARGGVILRLEGRGIAVREHSSEQQRIDVDRILDNRGMTIDLWWQIDEVIR